MSGLLSPEYEVARLPSRLTDGGIFVLIAQQHSFRSVKSAQRPALFLLRLWRGIHRGSIPRGEKIGRDERQFGDFDQTERDQSQHSTDHRPNHPNDQIQHIQQHHQKAADRKQQAQRHGNPGDGRSCRQQEHEGVHSKPLMGIAANHVPSVGSDGCRRQEEQSHGDH